MEAVLLGIATNLASTLLVAGAARLRDAELGDARKRALEEIFAEATAAMLVEMARHARQDRELPERLEKQFEKFFEDRWVAETLVSVALGGEDPPVERLRRRYEGLSFDPRALPIDFGRAMRLFAFELASRVRENARAGGLLADVVVVADVEAVREMLEKRVQARGPTGPDVDELERESLARCAERWVAAGLSPEEARALAADPGTGAPSSRLRAQLDKRSVAVVAGEVGAGKSLLLDRLLQRAIVRLREEPDAPLPTYVEAWEVEGRLRDAVLEKTWSLGDVREQGAAVFVDGAEEEGRGQARRLVKEARILVDTWPNTTVVVAGRPLPELAEDREVVEMPELTEDETGDLIEELSGEELEVAVTHRWPGSVREAVRRPLFAVLVALDIRERGSYNPRSVGELLSGLVDRALRKSDEVVDVAQLRTLAVASIDNSGAPVRGADVGTGEDVRRLLSTGLVADRDGMISFSLRILAEWFAAQALEHGLVDARDLASDLTRLERWRYPLAVAVGTFGNSRVQNILGPVVEKTPAFASQVVEEAVEKGFVGFRLSREGPPMSPEEFGRQLRETMGSWVRGIGPLAPLVAPVRQDGSLRTLGVSGSRDQVSRRSWYRGEENLGEVVRLRDHNPEMLPNWNWPSIRGVGTHHQAAWVWEYALEDLRNQLEKRLKERRLFLGEGLLAKENAWEVARGLAGERSSCRFVELGRIEKLLGFFGRDGADEVTLARGYGRPRRYDLRNLRAEFSRLRDAGEAELRPPWPMEDRLGDPTVPDNGRGGIYAWNLYSPEVLLRRVSIIMEGALDGYRRLVETYFSRLAPHMLVAATLPACLKGTLTLHHINEHPDHDPSLAWHLEPLPPGSDNDIRIEIGEEGLSREELLRLGARTRAARPQAAEWISSWEQEHGGFYGQTPATNLAYKWLWNDLRRVSWVEGGAPMGH
jgi:hypothetical protein